MTSPTVPVPSPVQLEIAVQDVQGALAAVRAGADRLELCVALGSTGGLTPSIGLVSEVLAALAAEEAAGGRTAGVCVLVRPAEGGFVYGEEAVRIMVSDVAALAALGRPVEGVAGSASMPGSAGPRVQGVVVGALTPEGAVDVEAMRRVMAVAGDLEVVFHRAIDVVSSPEELLPAVIELGCTRVLTSGGAAASGDGVEVLARLVEAAAGRVQIMAGGGVTIEAIPALIAAGVDSVHLSAKGVRASDPTGPGGGAPEVLFTDGAVVAAARAAVDAAAR